MSCKVNIFPAHRQILSKLIAFICKYQKKSLPLQADFVYNNIIMPNK